MSEKAEAKIKALEGKLSAIQLFAKETLEKINNSPETFYAEIERKYPEEKYVSVCVLKEIDVLLQPENGGQTKMSCRSARGRLAFEKVSTMRL